MKEIPNYPDYKIDLRGNVYSFKYAKPRILSKKISNVGYYTVVLCKNGITKTFTVHSLMAITYLDHIIDGYSKVVDHINGNQLDNRLENLRLLTPSENISFGKYSKRELPKGVSLIKRWYVNKFNEKVYNTKYKAQLSLNGKTSTIGYYDSPEEAEKAYLKFVESLKNTRQNNV